jgi:hypothetical protein
LAVTCRGIAVAIPNLFMYSVILADRPFARLSPATKQTLGVVGLITLVMGVASIVLPKVLRSNPYAMMEPLPRASAAAGEHGESSSETHADKSSAAEHKAEDKPSAHH